MAYDAATNQVVLFGGSNASLFLGDTWTWSGTSWAELSLSTMPAARAAASAAYDLATGQLAVFGGYDFGGHLRDTWEFVPVVPTAPSAPRSLKATAGNARVSLSWSAPTSDGGSVTTGYDVYEGTSPGHESTKPLPRLGLAP